MVRTNTVKLTVIDAAAYRQKLPSGGSGIVILKVGVKQPGIASISKTSGEAIPAANLPKDVYPQEAFDEAIALTAGLPYKKQGVVMLKEEAEEEAPEEEVVVDSEDYQKIVDYYTDKNGKLSYALLNKEMIKFAHSSSVVREKIAEGEDPEKIRLYIAGARFRSITGNHKMTDEEVLKIIELLDEVSPKGIFREFNEEIWKKI